MPEGMQIMTIDEWDISPAFTPSSEFQHTTQSCNVFLAFWEALELWWVRNSVDLPTVWVAHVLGSSAITTQIVLNIECRDVGKKAFGACHHYSWVDIFTWGHVCADRQPPVKSSKDQSGGITKASGMAPLMYMDAKVAFALAVPEDSDRDLLLQKYGAADIMATFKGAMELEMDPVAAFKRAMKAKLAEIVSPMATWLSTPSTYNPITSD